MGMVKTVVSRLVSSTNNIPLFVFRLSPVWLSFLDLVIYGDV